MQQVLSAVARPDKTTEAITAINGAIARFSALGNFSADVVEATVTLANSANRYLVNFPLDVAPLVRFRKFKYIKPTGWSRYMTFVEADRMFTDDYREKVNSWYRAGNSIIGKSSVPLTTLEVGFYQYPAYQTDMAATPYWMMSHPLGIIMIIQEAKGEVFEDIGDTGEAVRMKAKAMQNFTFLRDDVSTGYAHS